jgi:hypothetical protein
VLPGFIDTPILRPNYGDEAVDRLLDYLRSNSPGERQAIDPVFRK